MKFLELSALAAMSVASSSAFVTVTPTISTPSGTTLNMMSNNDNDSRRSFLVRSSAVVGAISASFISPMKPANAIPGVSVAEFESILKTSAKSVKVVELSGPKQETAIVTLIDGTQFVLSDVIESPSDPRSPLKLISTCRSYNVPTKAVQLEEAVLSLSSTGSKKKKVYMNKRVQIAAEKEREKKERMEQDEIDRLAELEGMKLK